MELKDVILSTLAEMEEGSAEESIPATLPAGRAETAVRPERSDRIENAAQRFAGMSGTELREDECRFLESVKERLLVLFEGFQSPNNTQIEAKVDLTLNFLEYLLATIDNRVENIKKSGRE